MDNPKINLAEYSESEEEVSEEEHSKEAEHTS